MTGFSGFSGDELNPMEDEFCIVGTRHGVKIIRFSLSLINKIRKEIKRMTVRDLKEILSLLGDDVDDMEVKIQITDNDYNLFTANVGTYEVHDHLVLQGEIKDEE